MSKSQDPVNRLSAINEVLRIVLLDEAMKTFISEGPFRRYGRGGMSSRMQQSQRLRDEMRQHRIMVNFKRTMERKVADQTRADSFREMVRQDRFKAAEDRYKARRDAALGKTPGTSQTGDTSAAQAQQDQQGQQGQVTAPEKGGPSSVVGIGEVGPDELKNIPKGVLGGPPTPEEQKRRDQGDAEIARRQEQEKAEGKISATDAERTAAAREVQAERGVRPNDKIDATQSREVQRSREAAKAAGVGPGGPNAPSADEQRRRDENATKMDAAKAQEGGMTDAQRTAAAREVQAERGVRPNQNLQPTRQTRTTSSPGQRGIAGPATRTFGA